MIVGDSQNINVTDKNTESFAEWQTAGAGCTSRAFKHPGHDVTRTWRLAVNFDWLHIWFRADNADGVPRSVSTQLDVPAGELSFLFYLTCVM